MKSVWLRGGSALVAGAVMSAGLVAASPANAVNPAIDGAGLDLSIDAHAGYGDCTVDESDTPKWDGVESADGNASLSLDGFLEGSDSDGTMSYDTSGTLTSAVTSGEDDTFESLTVSLTATASANGDSDCDGSIRVQGSGGIALELPSSGTLRFEVDNAGTGMAAALVDRYASSDYSERLEAISIAEGPFLLRTKAERRVEAGYYRIGALLAAGAVQQPGGPGEVSEFDGTVSAKVSFVPDPDPGDAVSEAIGFAKRFVNFPDEVDCASHKASMEFKSEKKQIKKVKKAVFKAVKPGKNETLKKLKAKKVKPGKKFNLKDIPAQTKKVKVKLKLKNGTKIKGKRKYKPC